MTCMASLLWLFADMFSSLSRNSQSAPGKFDTVQMRITTSESDLTKTTRSKNPVMFR